MDLIDRQQAIGKIKDWMKFIGYSHSERNVMECTIQMLEELPSAESCENHTEITRLSRDLIDRQDVINAICTWDKFGVDGRGRVVRWYEGLEPYVHLRDVVFAIEKLPSAEPKQKTGKWIPVDSFSAYGGDQIMWEIRGNPVAFHYCSECKEQAYANEDGDEILSGFCPCCGARMEVEE